MPSCSNTAEVLVLLFGARNAKNVSLTALLIIGGFAYSIVVSIRAYRETGKTWMLFLPHWIDANSGVSAVTRRHGKIAFAVLFAGMAAFLLFRA